MKSWTRTLNLDDAHTLLALAEVGRRQKEWGRRCHDALPTLSAARRRELIRLLREDFLDWRDNAIADGLFLRVYAAASASAQIDLVSVQWALSHPLTVIAIERLVAPALASGELSIPLQEVEDLVREHLETRSIESLRKTRTVLLGAMEGIGTLVTRGTGQHRSLRASRGTPHPVAFAFLVLRDLADRGLDGMIASEAVDGSLAVRLTQCTRAHAEACLSESLSLGLLVRRGDEIGRPR